MPDTLKTTYHHGDLKSVLVQAATVQIEKAGIDSVKVRALARDIGVTHRAAYVHFRNKDVLIATVIAAGYLRLASRLAQRLDTGRSPQQQLLQIAAAYSIFAFEEPNMFLAMTGPRLNADAQFPELESALQQAWTCILAPIKLGCASGVFKVNADNAAAFFWGGLQGILTQSLLNRIKISPKKRSEFMRKNAEMLIFGLETNA